MSLIKALTKKLPFTIQRKRPKRKALIGFGGRPANSYLIASTEQPLKNIDETSVRGILESAKLIESTQTRLNLNQIVKLQMLPSVDVTVPDDFFDYQNYLDAYRYVPKVRRAIKLKHSLIWQHDFTLEGDEADIKAVEEFLNSVDPDKTIKTGSLYALIFGNMYWHIKKENGGYVLDPKDPRRIGVKLVKEKSKEIKEYVEFNENGTVKEYYKPDEMLHLAFDPDTWSIFGTSNIQNVLPDLKAILYMKKKLPWLARRLARPLLEIQLGDLNENTIDEQEFERLKTQIENRPEDSDIYNDGSILKIEEVYKNIGNNRQMIEPVLDHYTRDLVAGLGVSDVALGFGGTTTMATAEYQERVLEPEVRSFQEDLTRFYRKEILSLAGRDFNVKLVWKPLKEDDKNALSARLCQEIEHGIISPEAAAKKLGYTEEDRVGIVMTGSLVPPGTGAPAQGPDEEKELRIAALKKLTGKDQQVNPQAKPGENTETGNKPLSGEENDK